jgi:hypothetical protein
MGKNGRLLGKNTTPLQLLLKVVKCSAAIPLHEFCFEEAFNSISSHIHGTTPSSSVKQGMCIIQTMHARLGLFTDTSVEVV